MRKRRTHVVIAGGGVAALELMLALRALAGERVEIDLLSTEREFVYRPLAVAEPFDVGKAHRFDLESVARDGGARLMVDALAGVDAERRLAVTNGGRQLAFDVLAIAVGARPREALSGALTFPGPGASRSFRGLLSELGAGEVERLAFAVPSGIAWALPLYELALMTATFAAARGLDDVRITLVTPEDDPLGLFGRRASTAVRAMLEERGIVVRTGAHPMLVQDDRLVVTPGEPVRADCVVALPRLEGPGLAGLPRDPGGFIPTDPYGRVEGLADIYAAGDATTFPVKQGGIATQQADAVAKSIAALAGAPVTPETFSPVLRGLLLTGNTPGYLQAEMGGGQAETSLMDMEPLWWPPGKIAGHYLSRYIATLVAAERPPEGGIRIEMDDLEPLLGSGR